MTQAQMHLYGQLQQAQNILANNGEAPLPAYNYNGMHAN